MRVKLDLHTHVWEAFNFQSPTAAMAERVVDKIKDRGIDGIAITDHHNKEFAFQFRELVERHYPGEVIIIPGWEIEVRPAQTPSPNTRLPSFSCQNGGVFRSYCHPGYYSPDIIIEDNIHAIEIDNYIHNWHIRKKQVTEVARTHDLLLLEVSDAHNIENIGLRYTELELEELYRRGHLIAISNRRSAVRTTSPGYRKVDFYQLADS